MDKCLNVLERDAKRMVHSISQSDYASVLKVLKGEVLKIILKLKTLFDIPKYLLKTNQNSKITSSS